MIWYTMSDKLFFKKISKNKSAKYKVRVYMYKVSNNDIINALDNAIASVEMEGFVFSDGERGLCRSVLEVQNIILYL